MGQLNLSTEVLFDTKSLGDKIGSAPSFIFVRFFLFSILYIDELSYALPYLPSRYQGYKFKECG